MRSPWRVLGVVIPLVLMTSLLGHPVHGQGQTELTVGFTVDVQTLDPRFVFSTQGISMMNHINEPLVTYDERGNLRPKLAERWEIPDPRTIRFHLRKGVTFQNGEPLNADAVKYTLEAIANPQSRSPQRSFLALIERVDVVDAYTADVKLSAPGARSVLRTLTYWGLIVPPRFARESGDKFTTIYGTGPYRFVEYRAGDRLVVERNPNYWGKAPSIPRIVFRVIPEPGTRVAALERGEIDIAYNFPTDQINRFRGNPSLFVFSKPTVRIAVVGFRLDKKPLDDVRVRQALAMAINRDEINRQLLGGRARVANTVVAPEVFGYAKSVSPPAYDPTRARQLLSDAGQSALRIRFATSNGRFQNDRQIGEAVAAYFDQAGVRVDFEAPEFGVFIRDVFRPESRWDAYLLSWATNNLDADFGISPVFHERFSTVNMYKNSEVSTLIDEARAATDEGRARDLYRRIQEILMRDLPWVPIVQVPDVIGMRRNVQGLQLRPDELIFFWNVTKR
jgi:peptide/nickel transport system substrate-binding protein